MASGEGAGRHGREGRGTGRELAAVLMLTAGSLVVVVGWLVGLVLLWGSRRWSTAEKWVATLVVPLGAGGLVTFGGVLTARTCVSVDVVTSAGVVRTPQGCSGPPAWVGPGLLLPAGLAGIVVAVVLYRRAAARR